MGAVLGGAWSWAAGFLLLLAVNGKQKMAWEKFGKEGNFSVSSSLEKKYPSSPQREEGSQIQPREAESAQGFHKDGAATGHQLCFRSGAQPASH